MSARENSEDKKAEAFFIAMFFFGVFLHEILPFLKAEAFLLSLAIGFAGMYHEKRTGETWDILINIFKKFLKLFMRENGD